MKLKLKFSDEYGDFALGGRFFERYVKSLEHKLTERIESMLEGKRGTINLVLVGDEKIHEINREHRKKDKPTDVITFAYLEGDGVHPGEEIEVGDIFISVDTAIEQASGKGWDLERELKRLFVHGLLHLFGFDHNNDEEEAEMEKWEKKIQEG